MGNVEGEEVRWPSGDCRPILATPLSVEELVKRRPARVFRDQDDLDFFTGAIWRDLAAGTVLIMRHDNNPEGLTAFYVDSLCDVGLVQNELVKVFEIGR